MKNTELGKSYWANNGAYSKEAKKLYDELVPDEGEAQTVNGELVRVISRLQHEYCNNGNGNARTCDTIEEEVDCYECRGNGEDDNGDVCDVCGGSGVEYEEYDGENYIEEFWLDMIDFVEETVPNISEDIKKVKDVILNDKCSCDDNEMAVYSEMIDKVMYYVLTTENKERV